MYRCAYGNAGNQSTFGAGEAFKMAKEAIDANRVELRADLPAVASWPKGFGKLLLNAILTTVEWLPRGGVLSLAVTELDGKAAFALTAEGQQANCSSEDDPTPGPRSDRHRAHGPQYTAVSDRPDREPPQISP